MSDDNEEKSIISRAKQQAERFPKSTIGSLLVASITALVPGADLVRDFLEQRLTAIGKKRFDVLLDELEKGKKLLTEDVIQSDEFLHSWSVVARAAINTYQHEKIRMFARLLLNGIEKEKLASDEFEEFVETLNSITLRELEILRILRYFEVNAKHQIETTDSTNLIHETAKIIWSDFEIEAHRKAATPPHMLQDTLRRLARTGLYAPIINYVIGDESQWGRTTPLFEEFSEWILREGEGI